MHVAAVETRGFRNLSDARIELGRGVAVLHGDNGAGKTNLLEAVYFGLAARSFRTGNDRDMIAFEQPSARVELELGAGEGTLLSALDRGGERRHSLDGRPLRGSGERPLVSVFHPDRMELIKGPAARRRGHLDRVVGALWPARSDLRNRFGRTLAQRNALASRVRAGHADPASLRTWDERLAAEAVPLICSRAEAVETLSTPVLDSAAALGLGEVELRYRPRAEPDQDAILAELDARRDAELTGRPSSASRPGGLGRAYTTYGPQLDEIEMRSGGRPLRRFGSQGQQRAALLALLFGERSAVISAGRPAPLMLLDDVMSELDPERRELLVATLSGAGQALITATEQRQVPSTEGLRSLGVREGRVLAAEPEAPEARAA
jgi:DNA replication and repair protein RecF